MSVDKSEPRWILVAGTGKSNLPPKIIETSQRLGRELADAGFGLVSGGWPGVDHLVARAFAETVKEVRGKLSDRLTQFMERGHTPDFPAGRFFMGRSDQEAWEASIKMADAVVLIGGIGGTYDTGKMARRQCKPVLPLADTRDEGYPDSYRTYFEMVESWDLDPVAGLTLEAFHCLADPAPDVVTDLVHLLETLFGTQPLPVLARETPRQSTRHAALEIWREKLDFLQAEEPTTVDPGQKFKLRKEIQEAETRIRELEAQP